MSRILAIDPGSAQSAWLLLADGLPESYGIAPNAPLLDRLADDQLVLPDVLVLEEMQSYGMPVGREVFDTVFWSGRFAQAMQPLPVGLITRKAVVTHICGSPRASDSNIRAALLERFGGKAAARRDGQLAGVTRDVWSALAIAIAWSEGAR